MRPPFIPSLLLLAACRTDPASQQDGDVDAVVDADGDGHLAQEHGGDDCDDDDPDVGSPDTWYQDTDSDGYGADDATVTSCSQPGGYVADPGDCDDDYAGVHPGADEYCDSQDNDCDGEIDEGALDSSTWHPDADGDGFGSDDESLSSCAQPSDYVADGTDCDDGDSGVNTGSVDAWYDGVDADCDGASDYDADGDGYDGHGGEDCDDTEPDVNPGLTDAWYDGVDTDCDGRSDYDADGDGYDFDAYGGLDCDDEDPARSPAATEICGDGIDNDCIEGAGDCGLGGPEGLGSADAVLWGEEDNDTAGMTVHADDLNGDGLTDVLIGTFVHDSRAGALYVVHGPVSGASSLASADAKIVGENPFERSSRDVDAGDMDGDGVLDLVIGADSTSGAAAYGGATYVLLGPVSGEIGLGDAEARLSGDVDSEYSGGSLSVGDTDGDGSLDVLIGAASASTGGALAGAAYLVLGPVAGEMALGGADAAMLGAAGDYAGSCVLLHDVNGDGLADALVGLRGADDNGNDSGAMGIMFGPISGDTDLSAADVRIAGEDVGDALGYRLHGEPAVAGDLDGDGYDDLVVGSYSSTAAASAGAVYVLQGPITGPTDLADATVTLLGETAYDGAGGAMALGDLNGDDQLDLIVGAHPHYTTFVGHGVSYVFFGPLAGSSSLAAADSLIYSEAMYEYSGAALASGDVNGDGYDDFISGAFGANGSGTLLGAVYMVLGGVGL